MHNTGIKSDLFELIEQTDDLQVLEAIKVLLQNRAGKQDFWELLPDEQKKSIERGLEQADKGETVANEEFIRVLTTLPQIPQK